MLQAAQWVSLKANESGFDALIDGQNVDSELRGAAVTGSVSVVAKMVSVRDWVNAQVRNAGEDYDVVVDGRDIGTVVFPCAALKVFLIADPSERAKRRLRERLGHEPAETEVAAETRQIVGRDEMDAAQSDMADDAIVIDTTFLKQPAQIDRILELARAVVG